jgi:dTMP kinase
MLKKWLEQEGESVVLSREPGGTDLGQGLRKILLGHETGEISPRAEALLYAADRAHHVYSVIRPALDRGDVVITDRYFDSSIAYQGAGRILEPNEVARISRWATESLFPTLTIIIDMPAEVGLGRLKSRDRLEAEPLAFHERVRNEFLQIASMDPERYLIVDGLQDIEEIHAQIISRVGELSALKRNVRDAEGNRLLKPIRRVMKKS